MINLLKKNTFILRISIFILLLLSTWNNNSKIFDESNGMIENKIGVPFSWLIIYSKEPSRSVFQLLFGGNEGIFISILDLLLNFIIIFSILLLIKTISQRVTIKKRKADKTESLSVKS